MSRRILHLSDLHFGRERPDLLRPLIEMANALSPDVVAISGDFTQRARFGQYRAARAFLEALEPPVIAVPGNHDTPLHNPAERLLDPWGRYRRYISDDLEPAWIAEDVAIHSVNTVNPLFWQRGHLRSRTLQRLCRAVEDAPGRLQIVMGHHPLVHPAGSDKRRARGADRALAALSRCGADVLLSGHLHLWRAGPVEAWDGLLLVQAGTGLSTRVRGEPNDFNLLTFAEGELRIDRHGADGDAGGFHPIGSSVFRKTGGRWTDAG